MDEDGGEQVTSRGRGCGRGRGHGRGRGRAHPAAVSVRQPAVRSGDINRLNAETHLYEAMDFQVPRMLELRRGSVAVLPPQSIVQYVRDAGFGG
ncbi:hypothetical protein PIB30_036677 [Stylosanthes scabra]|uniref:Uncharacterized protein n=1 Tax=Stylosanthes scabra TaxID=79078 RepID=A0ABU6XBY1_9FABA|nr:hypothetical protein [Stylosanthes scabra]